MFLHIQNKMESQNLEHYCIKDQGPYQNQDDKPQSGTSASSKALMKTQRILIFLPSE